MEDEMGQQDEVDNFERRAKYHVKLPLNYIFIYTCMCVYMHLYTCIYVGMHKT